ncbi:related to exonuclease REC1 [Ustilago trichophora]|uniref:Related to exonuclease REC1 n=1 Tax=Ustilago trichophora TaxID=86804 RepID=A0A5C3EBC9_9BASI|nr:related to exonuclease REC1 [Ustilago trichophora]
MINRCIVVQTLRASLSDVTGLSNLLKSVAIQTHAVVIASNSGLEIVTELNRTLQAHAYLYSHMFDSYHFEQPSSASSHSSASRPRARKRSKAAHSQSNNDRTQSCSGSTKNDGSRSASPSPPPGHVRNRAREAEDTEFDATQDEPASVSFEINLQTWISCLNIFGGVGPSRPHGVAHGHAGSRPEGGGGGAAAGGHGYARTSDGTIDPYSGDRGTSSERGLERNQPSAAKATRMRLSYQGHGHPLVLELEQEANVLTRCSMSTYEPSFLTDMVFDPRNMLAQVIVGSELLQSAFSEIDASCKKLSIFMASPDSTLNQDDEDTHETSRIARGIHRAKSPSMLRFRAISDTGSSEMEYPASLSSTDPTGVIEKFIALPGSSEQWYDFTLLSRTMTVLRSSIKTSLRMDEAGLISFQFMMPKYRRTVAPGAAGAVAGPAAGQAVLEDEQDAFCEFLVGTRSAMMGMNVLIYFYSLPDDALTKLTLLASFCYVLVPVLAHHAVSFLRSTSPLFRSHCRRWVLPVFHGTGRKFARGDLWHRTQCCPLDTSTLII